jgi:hypothetical protein
MTILTRRDICARALTPDWLYENGQDKRYFIEIGTIRDITNFDDEEFKIYGLPKSPEGKWCHRRMTRDEVAAFRTPMIAPFFFWPRTTEGGGLTNPPDDAPEPAFGEMVSWRTPVRKVKPYGLGLHDEGYDFRIGAGLSSPEVEILPGQHVYAQSYETFCIPDGIRAVCITQAIYGVEGLALQMNPLMPGFDGHARLTISNFTDAPQTIFGEQGIGRLQFEFIKG